MNTAVQFISGEIPDTMGRYIHDYFNFDDTDMEGCHNWVQWAFPINSVSIFNTTAPLIHYGDYSCLNNSEVVRANQTRIIRKYCATVGINIDDDDSCTLDIPIFRAIFASIIFNHNSLRLTRLLHHLRLSGREILYTELKRTIRAECLSDILDDDYKRAYDITSVKHWLNA